MSALIAIAAVIGGLFGAAVLAEFVAKRIEAPPEDGKQVGGHSVPEGKRPGSAAAMSNFST